MEKQNFNIVQVQQALQLVIERGLSAKARQRGEWLLHFCEHGYSVSTTCRHFGIPRMSLYRVIRRFDPSNPASLEDQSRRPHRVRASVASPQALPAQALHPLLNTVAVPETSRIALSPRAQGLLLLSVLANVAIVAFLLGAAFFHTTTPVAFPASVLPQAQGPALPGTMSVSSAFSQP